MQLLFSFDWGMRVEKTVIQTLASQLSSTLMQLLFSFDRGMTVEKTLMQTLASQLSLSFDLGLVVQSWTSANPGLNNSKICCFSLCNSAHLKYLNTQKLHKRKLLLIQTRFLKKYFQIYKQAVGKFALNFKLT
jgi:hypothetical protein